MVINGSFENSTNEWSYLIDVSLSDKYSLNGNYSLLLDIPTSNGIHNMSMQSINNKPIFHHKYYGKIYYYSEYSFSFGLRFEWHYNDMQGSGLLLFTSPTLDASNSWKYQSDIIEVIDTAYLNQIWRIRNFTYSNSYPIYVDNLIMIDLTETFGVGNEPDKEWCDRHINYFDGSSIIYK